jgi:hypothetical protein
VALAALQTLLNRQVRLGVSAQSGQAKHRYQALQEEPGETGGHGETSTLNVKE